MKSIRSVYKIGHGPSSSHTVGPYRAAKFMGQRYPEADAWKVTLYGSLAFTGEGHGTGKAIRAALPEAEIIFNREEKELPHPNTMVFTAMKDGKVIASKRIFSIGGGSIRFEGESSDEERIIYPQNSFSEVLQCCKQKGITLTEFIYRQEDADIKDYLRMVWEVMQEAIRRGLKAEGILPGGLGVSRKAKLLYNMRCYNENADVTMNRLIAAYAYAVSEENADENLVVTAPTILDALAAGGIIGNLIRTNASISGAECGCQAEIGSACSMTAAALATLYRLNIDQIEYAAEIAMEHNLGLTCDPVNGLVQIPCIERNAVAAMRAISSVNLSRFLYATRKISFDEVVATMYRTGKDMNEKYRETSHGGLAQLYSAKT